MSEENWSTEDYNVDDTPIKQFLLGYLGSTNSKQAPEYKYCKLFLPPKRNYKNLEELARDLKNETYKFEPDGVIGPTRIIMGPDGPKIYGQDGKIDKTEYNKNNKIFQEFRDLADKLVGKTINLVRPSVGLRPHVWSAYRRGRKIY